MDKIVWVCILMTLLGFKASADTVADIKAAAPTVKSECVIKNPNSDCIQEEADLNAATTEDEACKQMWNYVACITVNCVSKPELTTAVDEIKNLCSGDEVKAIQGEIPLFNLVCTYTNPSDNCDNKEATLKGVTTKPDACTAMWDYTACTSVKCESKDELSNAVAKIQEPCSGDKVEVIKGQIPLFNLVCTYTNPSDNCDNKEATLKGVTTKPDACIAMWDYTACTSVKCESKDELSNAVAKIQEPCSDPVDDIKGAALTVKSECVIKNQNPDCSSEESELIAATTEDEACTKMWTYVACITVNCVSKPELTTAVDEIKKLCSGDEVEVIKGQLPLITLVCTYKNQGDNCDSAALKGVTTKPDACTAMWEYTACTIFKCDSKDELSNAVAKIQEPCSGDEVGMIKGQIPIITLVCIYKNQGDNCDSAALKGVTTKPDACTNVKEYTSCVKEKCNSASDLTTAINTMEEPCNGGPRLLQVSGLTFLLVAIVKFI